MVYDIVPYNGEEEMFNLRYEILKDDVDEFIVVEFDSTFSGKYKPRSDFKERPKVKYHYLDRSYYEEYLGADIDANFQMEYAQREAVKKILQHLNDDDIVYSGDVDEIWKPKNIGDGVYKLEQIMYYYFLDNKWNRGWSGTFVGRWKHLKDISWNTARMGPGQRLDTPSSFPNLIKDGGWHFTNCMNLKGIIHKLESYSHQEYNTQQFKDDLPSKMKDNRDYYGATFPQDIDTTEWPQYLKDNKSKYIHLCAK